MISHILNLLVTVVVLVLPDSNNLAHVQGVVIHLGDEDGSDRLIECRSIHVDGGTHRENKSSNPLVNAIVLLSTSERDRQRGGAGR